MEECIIIIICLRSEREEMTCKTTAKNRLVLLFLLLLHATTSNCAAYSFVITVRSIQVWLLRHIHHAFTDECDRVCELLSET